MSAVRVDSLIVNQFGATPQSDLKRLMRENGKFWANNTDPNAPVPFSGWIEYEGSDTALLVNFGPNTPDGGVSFSASSAGLAGTIMPDGRKQMKVELRDLPAGSR